MLGIVIGSCVLAVILLVTDQREATKMVTSIPRENLILRTEDLIELCMRNEKGLTWFRADHCVYRMEVASTVRLRRGITYTFNTYYTYQ